MTDPNTDVTISKVERLTRREREILTLLGQNLTDREIAAQLVLSVNSVKWYAHRIYEKLEVRGRQKAVQKARQLNLLAEPIGLEKPTHNLPRQLTSFIGRRKEISQLVEVVKKHPLITLTGSGGVGKTRLAVSLLNLPVVIGQLAGLLLGGVAGVAGVMIPLGMVILVIQRVPRLGES